MARHRNTYIVERPPEQRFGDLIRELRLERGMSQQQFADAVSDDKRRIGQNIISGYERGRTKHPDPDLVCRLDAYFGLEAGTMLKRSGFEGGGRLPSLQAPSPGSMVIESQRDDPLYRVIRLLQQSEDAALERLEQALRGSVQRQLPAKPKPDTGEPVMDRADEYDDGSRNPETKPT
jgi:transcriptional regulator with XRE-family HTH domain